jgi:hypothetical protein
MERKITPFVEWLSIHKDGEVDTELTAALREVIEAVQSTGKEGTVTLTLKVKRRGERQVTVLEDVKAKTPVHDRADSIYFVDRVGNLRRDDPGQEVLPFAQRKTAGGDE